MTMTWFIFIYIISTFAAMQTTSNATNVALHKWTDQSSVFVLNDIVYNGSRAVDGNRSNGEDLKTNSCSHTNDSSTIKQAWWRVNLESIYSITTVTITYRDWKNGNKSGAGRLAGFSIYVSDTSNWWNGVLCYHDNKTTLPDTRDTFYIFCYQPVTGQYVTIYNDRNSTQPPIGYSTAAILELCEVEIQIPSPCSNCLKNSYPYCQHVSNVFRCLFGCEKGHYGEDCQDICTCGGNGSCYQNGTCTACDLGYYPSGTQCVACHQSCGDDGACEVSGRCLSCDPGTYKSGAFCVPCPSTCDGDNQECNGPDGTCIRGCKDGYFGERCNEKCMTNCDTCYNSNTCDDCSRGYFGTNCNSRCDVCQDLYCNREGQCIKSCVAGRHGTMCNLNCSDNCLLNFCDRNTGNCTRGCVSATYGPHCNRTCPSGCGADTKTCTRLSGLCTSCINGKYGDQCTSNCSNSCGGNRECAIKTGHCVFCAAGLTGPFCNEQIQSESGVPMGAMAGVTSVAVVVIVTLIIVIVWMKRGNSVKRDNIYSSATTDSSKADAHVYLSVGYTSENGINTHGSAATNPSEGHNDSNTKTPSEEYEDTKELARERVPSDKTHYYNL